MSDMVGKNNVTQDPQKWKMTVNFKTAVDNSSIEEEGQQQAQEDKETGSEDIVETQMV